MTWATNTRQTRLARRLSRPRAGQDPRIHGAGELQLARRSFESIPTILGRSDPPRECVPHLDRTGIERLALQHLAGLDAIDGGRAECIIDKMPENYMYLGQLSVSFPQATFIHCRRDPRDIAVSCWMSDFRILRWANAFEHIASRFAQYLRLMGHWRAVVPISILDIDYERTVDDLEATARRTLKACRLEWEPARLFIRRGSMTPRDGACLEPPSLP